MSDFHRIFDEIIEKYDVYKVETIGDGYMVASGLPELNGSEHARQIALMSLELMSSMANFVVPHDENEEVNLRVGIHSGEYCIWKSQIVSLLCCELFNHNE